MFLLCVGRVSACRSLSGGGVNLWISFPAPESMEHNIREMYRLIAQLKTLEKAIILLYLEEKTYQEIADITGLTVSNVAIKLKRAKE